MTFPTLDEVQALDGRIFAMLTTEEQSVLDFYRARGRKYDVAVSIINEADPEELIRATSLAHADQVLKSANSRVSVVIGPSAASAWYARASID